MPDLAQSQQGQDIGFLRIIANQWDIDAPADDSAAERTIFFRQMLQPDLVQAVFLSLTDEAKQAVYELQRHRGRILWNQFTRKYGEMRDFGPSWRDREQPQLNPISTSEVLWYHGFISRAFLKQGNLPLEFAFIPSDLIQLIPPYVRKNSRISEPRENPGGKEPVTQPPYTTRLLDDLCTALAALRCGLPPYQNSHLTIRPPYSNFLGELLRSTGQISNDGILQPEKARQLLEAPREDSFLELFRSWRESTDIYELALVPAIRLEGSWTYDAREARNTTLHMVMDLHTEEWISLQEFCRQVKDKNSDFLRPDGNYDTWLVRTRSTGEPLQGYEHWDDVEGAYLRFLLLGPLFWMGVVVTQRDDTPGSQIFFRLTELGQDLINNSAPPVFPSELGKVNILKGTTISVSAAAPRWVRYMIARMSEWLNRQGDIYYYRLTPESLANARKQSLNPNHLIKLLQRYASPPPKPTLVKALQRWDEQGGEAVVETVDVLRVQTPYILNKLRDSQSARFLGEPLGPTSIILKPGAREMVMRTLIELGYFTEYKKESPSLRPDSTFESEHKDEKNNEP